MFVRKKINKSGTTSVVVVDKVRGKFNCISTIGVSKDPDEIARFVEQGNKYILAEKLKHNPEIDFEGLAEKTKQERLNQVKDVFSSIDNILHDTPQQILNRVFDGVGFNAIDDPIFRNLVLARLAFPSSKKATVEYLKSHFDEDIELHKIYRYLSRLNDSKQALIQDISVRHTMNIYGGTIGVLFYDVTTLYFETDKQDDLRKTGFSKEGRHSNPQIVLGLLVSGDGCPLAYTIHNGKQYEGHTMLPIIEKFIELYSLEDFVVVADSGMLNSDNIEKLEEGGYKYIIGARIKNSSSSVKKWILSLEKRDGLLHEFKEEGSDRRLIIGYTADRAKKDKYNRDKGIRALDKKYKSGKVTKSNITQRGYNKLLTVTGTDELAVIIDPDKIAQDEKWDGLKGYITNATLECKEIIAAYNNLFNVERSFRISKSKLEIRPIFHFTEKRIKAHIAICFVALKIYKELERLLKLNDINLSVDKVLEIAKTIVTIRVRLNNDKYDDDNIYSETIFVTNRHRLLEPLFSKEFWVPQILTDNQ